MGTALPTLSVFDDAGWHRAPFENLGESFYSVAADYEVTFVTPRGLDTAATGTMSERVGHYVARHHLDIARTEDFMAAIATAAAKHLPGFDVVAYWDDWWVAPS